MSDQSNKTPKRRLPAILVGRKASSPKEDKKQKARVSFLTPSQKEIIGWIAITLGVSFITALAIYLVKRANTKKKSIKAQSQSLGTGEHETWAKQIYRSLRLNYWVTWGTEVPSLRNAIRKIPTQDDWNLTVKKYSEMYPGRNMVQDITKDLSESEYDEMTAIINAKPKTNKDIGAPNREVLKLNWALRIRAAMDYRTWGFMAGTDEDAIKAVFMEYKAQSDYWGTKRHYLQEFGKDMFEDLKAEMDDIHDYLKIVWRKPKKMTA